MKYFAYTKNGKRKLGGPYPNRTEAKAHGKPGHECRFCGESAGGASVCYTCVCIALSPKKLDAGPPVVAVHREVQYRV